MIIAITGLKHYIYIEENLNKFLGSKQLHT